jgi:hypothetical protein
LKQPKHKVATEEIPQSDYSDFTAADPQGVNCGNSAVVYSDFAVHKVPTEETPQLDYSDFAAIKPQDSN